MGAQVFNIPIKFGTLFAITVLKTIRDMKKFNEFQRGDMFFFNPLDKDWMKPEVYVMLEEGIVQGYPAKVFIKNSALVKHLISNYEPYPSDTWAFTEAYFGNMEEIGHIIPIDDLREADELCDKYNLTMDSNF